MQRMSLQAKTILQCLYDLENFDPSGCAADWKKGIPQGSMPIEEAGYVEHDFYGDKRTRKDRKRSARRCCQMLERAGLIRLSWDYYWRFHPYEEHEADPIKEAGLSPVKEMYDRGREWTLIRTVSLTDAGREIAKDLDVLP